jgi:ribosome-binding factor A
MKSKKPSRRDFLSSCHEIGPDDGADPKTFFQKGSRRRTNRKTLQLCGEIARTLRQILAWESGDELLRGLTVTAVEPAPDSTRVLVTVTHEAAGETADAHLIVERLRSRRGWLRSEIAAVIHRKQVPDLVFRVLATGEADA